MATRSRNPDNPSDRKTRSNGTFCQFGELKKHASNTITSVAKDNYVVEFYESEDTTSD
jgi:hypothetical protein